jgi:hypothetical protein
MDVGDGVGEQDVTDLAVGGLVELHLEVGRAAQPDDLTGQAFGIAQVVQPSDNLVLPFGLAPPCWKRALAAFTNLSSASSSFIRRRAASSGSAS